MLVPGLALSPGTNALFPKKQSKTKGTVFGFIHKARTDRSLAGDGTGEK